jgi:hypothetical protein
MMRRREQELVKKKLKFSLSYSYPGSNENYERLGRILSKSMCLRALSYSYSAKGAIDLEF